MLADKIKEAINDPTKFIFYRCALLAAVDECENYSDGSDDFGIGEDAKANGILEIIARELNVEVHDG